MKIVLLSFLLFFISQKTHSAPNASIKHNHNGRSHTHPLPNTGLNHQHNKGASSSSRKRQKGLTEKQKISKAIVNYKAYISGKKNINDFSPEETKYLLMVSKYYKNNKQTTQPSVSSYSNSSDILVQFINGQSLPYEYSSSNYDNSSSNYDNSVSNYDNSPSNYDNSESNYDNSASNYENGASGNRRLILNRNGGKYRVGYYVRADNGVLNFFSTKGKRMFYNPGKGVAVFHGKSGFFSGVIARSDGVLKLLLNKKGEQVIMLQ